MACRSSPLFGSSATCSESACRQGQTVLAGFTIICVEASDIEQFFRRKKARKPC
jgi:hypothetical protein